MNGIEAMGPALVHAGLPLRALWAGDQPDVYFTECVGAWITASAGDSFKLLFTTFGSAEFNDEDSNDNTEELATLGVTDETLVVSSCLTKIQTLSLFELRESLDTYPGVGDWSLGLSVHCACASAIKDGITVYGPVEAYNLIFHWDIDEANEEVTDLYLDHQQQEALTAARHADELAGRDPEATEEPPRLKVEEIDEQELFTFLRANGLTVDALTRQQMRLPAGRESLSNEVDAVGLRRALKRGVTRGMDPRERRALGVLVGELEILEALSSQLRAVRTQHPENVLLDSHAPPVQMPTIILDVTSNDVLMQPGNDAMGVCQEAVHEYEVHVMEMGEDYGRQVIVAFTPGTVAVAVQCAALLKTIEARALCLFEWAEQWPPQTPRPHHGAVNRGVVEPAPAVTVVPALPQAEPVREGRP